MNNEEPFVGLVSEDDYIESYGLQKAKEHVYHHQYALSQEGSPALDPFGRGYNQIKLFARHCFEMGVASDTLIEIADHGLNQSTMESHLVN